MSNGSIAIIFEGPDGGGKTTLAEELRKRWADRDIACFNHGPYPGEDEIALHYFKSLARGFDAPNRVVLLDRCWISEVPYGLAFRSGLNRIAPAYRRMLERTALTLDAIVINCTPSTPDPCLEAYRARKHLEYLENEDQLRSVWEWFDQLTTATAGLTTLRYDRTKPHAIDNVIEDLEWMFDHGPRNVGPGGGAWAVNDSILIVGDRPNTDRTGTLKHRIPFVGFHGGGAGAWLADQLEAAAIPESALYWINAYDAEGTPTPSDFIAALRPRAIVPLGDNARAWCDAANVWYDPAEKITHPQHHKRFHFGERYPLITHLKEYL